MTTEMNEYEQERRAKLQKLRDLGVDPYGAATPGLQPLAEIKSLFRPEMGQDGGPVVKAAGRVVLSRSFGKLTFITLRDETGDLQIGLDKKRLSERDWEILNLVDLGDQITVEGLLGVTKKGETTIWAGLNPIADGALTFASKSLLPPPGKWDGLSDVEQRYRQRYVDLWSNPEVMRTMKLRIRIVDEVRKYLKDRGFIEVETPMLQPMHGGAAAKPFKTHHNALDMPLFLRIAPELYLKRLLVGGFSKVFEINRNFRNEGISPRHNPEFTMLEAYEAYGSWETMADLVEGMICHVAERVFGTLQIEHKNAAGEVTKTINLQRPWRRVRMVDLVEERTGWRFSRDSNEEEDVAALIRFAREERTKGNRSALNRRLAAGTIEAAARFESGSLINEEMIVPKHIEAEFLPLSKAERLVRAYEKFIEPELIDPVFVTHVPSVVIPLAKENNDDPFFADVYELAINGQEISPGYTELNDPDVQAKHFAHQVGDKEEQQKVDEDFLNALRYGMPPAGGIGLGIDRLVTMLTGAQSLRDVILFPLMRPRETFTGGVGGSYSVDAK